MALHFSEVSTLLCRLEDIELQDPPILDPREKASRIRATIESWFKSHRRATNEFDVAASVAFISTFLPERRTDRVYEIQAPRLCRILCRCMNLSASRAKDMQAYQQVGGGDLGSCLQRVLANGGPPARPSPTVVEIDDVFDILASQSRFSAPHLVKLATGSSKQRDHLLGEIVKRLTPAEGKWFVRLILKDLSPVRIDEQLLLKTFHFLLPDLLRFQDDLEAAVRLLKTTLNGYPETCDVRSESLHRQNARASLKPAVGVKVGRPEWTKARSIDHCMKMTAGQRWVLERKYDGEYCEIHIDLARSADVYECITIFSKSSKDSTADRRGLIHAIINCFRLGKAGSKIKRQAILLGEMVVYSDSERRILQFEKIRKYVTRSGSFIGTNRDSPPNPDEHLAIVFFDILLLDDELILSKSVDERRMWLRNVCTKIPGRAMSSEWKIVDFSDPARARKALVLQFAASIAERCEGLILKPCDAPYFALDLGSNGRMQTFIKLKKDYIAGLGDEADLAVVGASYNAQQAAKCGLGNVQWTDFHLACLMNKQDVLRFDVKPRFKVVGTIQQECCIPKPVLQAAIEVGRYSAMPFGPSTSEANTTWDFVADDEHVRMDVLFSQPFVFEVLGSGFEKPSDCSFYMLRHPRVKKLHRDRSWKDCVSFQELQDQALKSREAAYGSASQETIQWIERLEKKCLKKFEWQRTRTPSTVRSATTTSTSGQTGVSALDGTTLINTCSLIRERESEATKETPCLARKQQRTDSPIKAISASSPRARGRPPPLSDITNTTPSTDYKSPVATKSATKQSTSKSLRNPRTLSSSPYVSAAKPSASCRSSICPFADSTIYIASCIARTPYITQDLLPTHSDLIVVPDLTYWDREVRLPTPPSTASSRDEPGEAMEGFVPPPSVIGESQAYEGMRKIVLVEGRRKKQVEEIKLVLREMEGRRCFGRNGVEVWDWRVLETWSGHGSEQ